MTDRVLEAPSAGAEPTVGKQAGGRWQSGQSGNPAGRPRGARGRASVLAEQLLADEAGIIVRTVIERAVGGDATCLRLCLERLVPPVRERAVEVAIPRLATIDDAVTVLTSIVQSAAAGEIAPGEAAALAGVVDTFRRTVETQELDARVRALELLKERR